MSGDLLFDARDLSRAWLSAAIASGDDSSRPALHRTILVEQFASGIRVVSTDSYLLVSVWVPTIEDDFALEPGLDEAPVRSTVVVDGDKRCRDLMAYLWRATKAEGSDSFEVRLSCSAPDGAQPALDPGLAAVKFIVEVPGAERLILDTYDGSYPSWRSLHHERPCLPVSRVGIGTGSVLRLGKLSTLWAKAPLTVEWSGETGPATFRVQHAESTVHGLMMPVRVDFTDALDDEAYAATLLSEIEAFLADTTDGDDKDGDEQ